ncbi:fibronectin type III domain-containing protein [Paracoccus sulfuroxidans]|nr:fibronectin type III domain-containing protein [Paracoccus sulfuroxidans]
MFKTAVSVGLSKVAQKLQKPTQSGGVRTSVTVAGESTSQTTIFGRYCTGGAAICPPYVFDFKGDMDSEYLVYVIALADTRIQGVESMIVDGRQCSIAERQRVPGQAGYIAEDNYGRRVVDEDGKLDGYVFVRIFDGTQIAADPKLVEMFGTHPSRPWDSSMIMTGVAYAVVTFKFRQEKFTGLPDCKFTVLGMRMAGTRSTAIVYRENPVDMVWNILKGIPLPGGSGTWGLNVPAEAVSLPVWRAAANVCDELTNGNKRYRAGIEFSFEDEPLEVIDEILKSCGGQIAECGGVYNISVGAPLVTSASITDDDVLISDDREFIVSEGLAKIFNGVTASYPDPDRLWEEREAVPYKKAEWIAQDDGRELLADLKLSAVPYPEQVRRLIREYAADNRRQRRHIITVGPWALSLMPLQTIGWTSVENGYISKLFEITSMIISPDSLNVTLALRERDPADYDYDAVSDGVLPSTPSVRPNPSAVSGVRGWSVQGTSIKDSSGKARRPALRLSWSSGAPYSSISYEVRLVSNLTVVMNGSVPDVSTSNAIIASSILPDTEYEVRALAKIQGRDSTWSDWAYAKTPAVFIGEDDFEDGVRGLFEDAGMKAIEYMSTLPMTGNTIGRMVYLTTDNKLYRWTGTAWVNFVQDNLQGALDETAFAQGISIPRVVTALPTSGNTIGRLVVLSSDSKLYRWTGTAWTAAVSASDVTGQITATQITDNAITTPKLASGSITTDKLGANSVVAGKVAAGAIGVDQLAAGSVVASKMAITDFTNLVPDDQIQDASSWTGVAPAHISHLPNPALPALQSKGCFRVEAAGATATVIVSKPSSAKAGEEYFYSGQVFSAGAAEIRIVLQFLNRDGGLVAASTATNGAQTGWRTLSGSLLAPSGTTQVRMYFNIPPSSYGGDYSFMGTPIIRIKGRGELIVDGSISGDKITANTITGGLMAAAGIITGAAQINDAVITNAKIANATISGAKIANLTVDTINIKDRAITDHIIDEVATKNLVRGATGAIAHEMVFTLSQEAAIIFGGYFEVRKNNTSATLVSWVTIDGVELSRSRDTIQSSNVRSLDFMRTARLSAGTHRIRVMYTSIDGTTGVPPNTTPVNANFYIDNINMFVFRSYK